LTQDIRVYMSLEMEGMMQYGNYRAIPGGLKDKWKRVRGIAYRGIRVLILKINEIFPGIAILRSFQQILISLQPNRDLFRAKKGRPGKKRSGRPKNPCNIFNV